MASRKLQKEAARNARLEAERQAKEQRMKRTRLMVVVGAVVAALVVVGIILAVSLGGNSNSSAQSAAQVVKANSATTSTVNSILAGIPQNKQVLGDPKAKITLSYYGDLECPICMAFTTGEDNSGLPQFIANQVKTGQAKLQYKSYCTATCNDYTNDIYGDYTSANQLFDDQQVAAYAAGLQNKFWNYEEIFYREQGTEGSKYVNQNFLNNVAHQVPGLNYRKWLTDLKDPSLTSQVQSEVTEASRAGVQGTPTVFISGPKGTQEVGDGVQSYSTLMTALRSVS